eukprot:TRINITY_DN17266_c0_g1_i2.p1 TRINITY_DN17266_c0_g1~~TRINITY_DN17266_c0_g1_i2.p1  ORF type:complete len:208 (+),score=65.97 TRINITY_DN17266_c0_g1_i2:199-822(+)
MGKQTRQPDPAPDPPSKRRRRDADPDDDPTGKFKLSEPTQRALTEILQYTKFTPVQRKCLPHLLRGRDVVVKAQTGSGKTSTFLIPAIERTIQFPADLRKGMVSALVLAPTRELAQQISAECQRLLEFHPLKVSTAVGGDKNVQDNIQAIGRSDPDILVATPGRLLDLLRNTRIIKRLQPGYLKMVVLDEADRLLQLGLGESIKSIM